jgi:uncharacterized repeat protein (TIGR03803 family)
MQRRFGFSRCNSASPYGAALPGAFFIARFFASREIAQRRAAWRRWCASAFAALILSCPAAPALAQDFTFANLHDFDSTAGTPSGGVVGASGNLYGVAQTGGANGHGGLFMLGDPPGGSAFTIFYSFTAPDGLGENTDGAAPLGILALSPDGTLLYGTTSAGGTFGQGTLFSIPLPSAETPNPLPTTLASFGASTIADGLTGRFPHPGQLAFGGAGAVYGVTGGGGANGLGQVWKYDGSPHAIHDFGSTPSDGILPVGGLVAASDGTLLGVTQQGGAHGSGTIYAIGAEDAFIDLYDYSAATPNAAFYPVNSDGNEPVGLVPFGTGNSFYVITSYGGSNGLGSVGEVDASGNYMVLGDLPGVDGNGFNTEGALAAGPPVVSPDGLVFCSFQYDGQDNSGTLAQIVLPDNPSPGVPITVIPVRTFSALSDSGTNTGGARPGPISLLPVTGASYGIFGMTGEGGANGTGGIYLALPATAPPPAPTVHITVTPDSVSGGPRPVTLNWSSVNADTCEASGSWEGSKPLTGSTVYSPSSDDPNSTTETGTEETFDFTLTCTNVSGSAHATAHLLIKFASENGGGAASPGLLIPLFGAWYLRRRRVIALR